MLNSVRLACCVCVCGGLELLNSVNYSVCSTLEQAPGAQGDFLCPFVCTCPYLCCCSELSFVVILYLSSAWFVCKVTTILDQTPHLINPLSPIARGVSPCVRAPPSLATEEQMLWERSTDESGVR